MPACDRGVDEIPMADLALSATERVITGLEHDPRGLTVTWDDGCRSRFHVLWLRDNCPCPQCRHPQALERTYMFINEPAPVIRSASLLRTGVVEVEFDAAGTKHRSRYAKGWLRARHSSDGERDERVVELWDGRIAKRLATVGYAQYRDTTAGLRTWIHALKTQGIVLLKGVPQASGELLTVAQRIGPVRSSNFGHYYDVLSLPHPNASAYTDMGLELHTDLANWRSPPDVQMLCCLKNGATGGESLFADGFRVAEDLRIADPKAFELLSTQPLEYRFHDQTCDIRTLAPVIELDREGRLQRIRFNNWLRGTAALAEELVDRMYASLGAFWRMLRDPKYRLVLRLEPGDLISYDNNRVLHGREPFDASSGERHLQGCYLNQEDVDSALRVLERRTVSTG